MKKSTKSKRPRSPRPERHISIRSELRQTPDTAKLVRAVLEYARRLEMGRQDRAALHDEIDRGLTEHELGSEELVK